MVALESRLRTILAALLTALVTLALCASAARAGTANAGLPASGASNPLSGMTWGHYTGSIDGVYPAYEQARGRARALMAKIALRPLTFWFGDWYPTDQARAAAQQYVAQDTDGNPNELAQLAVFRLDPWEGAICGRSPSRAQQSSYRAWIDNFAAGIGSSRVALILQPDLPFALCASSRRPAPARRLRRGEVHRPPAHDRLPRRRRRLLAVADPGRVDARRRRASATSAASP